MKRIVAALLLTALLICCGCNYEQPPIAQQHTVKGIWLTAQEIACNGKTREQYTEAIESAMKRITAAGLTDIFVQLRPNCDALYDSDIFPKSDLVGDYDIFEIILSAAHDNGLYVHAWINPYRVSTAVKKIKELPNLSPAKKLYKTDKTAVLTLESGIYLNPANISSQRLITEGVREILNKYPVDGIHIDDYFYPADIGSADSESYTDYREKGGGLDLYDYRRAVVSSLVSGIYSAVKGYNDSIMFSVSPAGDIERCYDGCYADVELWCSEYGYCDLIIPQIYFGFENSFLPFEDCLEQWLAICESEKLCIGLALYKQGKEDIYAGEGKNEWLTDDGIIERQTEICENKGCGFCLFSFDFLRENS